MKARAVLVYADSRGNILDLPALEMAADSGGRRQRPDPADLIPLPPGSELFLLPGRLPVGYDRRQKKFRVLAHDPYDPARRVQAVAAFIAPAHTTLFTPAYHNLPRAPLLPLFAYTAVGFQQGRLVVAGMRVDADERQDAKHFDRRRIERNARRRMQREPRNRLLQHLGKCALSYGCPAAKNLFMNRWEAPLPTSPRCNARCLGCISRQDHAQLCATQERITFVPTIEEILAVAGPHLLEAPRAVVSFGQGCEGEPLLQAKTLEPAIASMRRATRRGTINLNSNAGLPHAVEQLRRVGLDSMRVSLNSCRAAYYHAYHRPTGYRFEDVLRSIRTMKTMGGFVSLNYFVMPGFTDDVDEFDALRRLLDETEIDLIQLRNLNIDPEWYLRSLPLPRRRQCVGMRSLIETLQTEFPAVRLGYFNPPLDPQTIRQPDFKPPTENL